MMYKIGALKTISQSDAKFCSFPLISGSPLPSSPPSSFTAASCANLRLTSLGDSPALFVMVMLAPISISHCKISKCPCPAAEATSYIEHFNPQPVTFFITT